MYMKVIQMTLKEMKNKVLKLIEESNPESELLTDDPDISAKINDVINQIQNEMSRIKKIPANETMEVKSDDEIAGLDAQSCMYRIYRDIRFSPDKTPYKTYMSAYIAKGGRKSLRAGYYFHFEPGNCMLSGGIWCPEPQLLKALRQAVYDNFDELKEIVEDRQFKSLYSDWVGEKLKIVPRPFPRDCEQAEWLKRKDYVVVNVKPDTFFDSPDWIERAAHDFQIMKPLNDFLNYTVDEVYDL